MRGQQPVLDLILQRLPNTLALAFSAMAIAAAIGLRSASSPPTSAATWIDTGLMNLAIAGVSIPHFWLGLVLLFVFAVDSSGCPWPARARSTWCYPP